MTLFFQIMLGSLVLVFVLITVHEIGHWCLGRLAGLPGERMRILLLRFPQQVQLHDGREWLSVDHHDEYMAVLHRFVPGRWPRFAYVAGGFLFESLFLSGLCLALHGAGNWLFALVAAGVSLTMFLVYILAMDLPQSRALGRPWGDTSILLSLSRTGGWITVLVMVGVRLGLGLAALP